MSIQRAVDLRLEAVVEHVADHGHAAQHPLAAAAQLLVVELRHRAVAVHQGLQQRHYRVGTDCVALRQLIDFLLALVSQSLHTRCSWVPGDAIAEPARPRSGVSGADSSTCGSRKRLMVRRHGESARRDLQHRAIALMKQNSRS
jgi:hypothetical protein